jgi:hypothetical protein
LRCSQLQNRSFNFISIAWKRHIDNFGVNVIDVIRLGKGAVINRSIVRHGAWWYIND